jgi:hypothetical protein
MPRATWSSERTSIIQYVSEATEVSLARRLTEARPSRINPILLRRTTAKGDDDSVVLYCYQSQGRAVTPRCPWVIPADSAPHELADAAGQDFVQAAYPVISAYLPR